MELKCYQIDAFTDAPFAGNPAAVVLLPRHALPLSDTSRQAIAAEFNLSETAFLEYEGSDTDGNEDSAVFTSKTRFRLRWFTPAAEVVLCGHATLAAAAALLFEEGNPAAELAFDTLSGELRVARQPMAQPGSGSSAGGRLSMDLPLVGASAAEVPAGMQAASPLVQAACGGLPVAEVLYAAQLRYLVIVLNGADAATRQAFLALRPSGSDLAAAHTGGQLVGVIVTMQADGQQHDFYSRFFGPWVGIAEDPVTGSAHSVLGPYWADRLGQQHLRARQCSARGGELAVEVRSGEGRVTVSGNAVTTLRAQLLLPQGSQ